MKFSFKFSNILGAVYQKGNVVFTPDGNSLITPIGNRICLYNLKNHTATTLSVQSELNYERLALSPSGNILIAINEGGGAHFIILVSGRKLFDYRFNGKINSVSFSPDGRYFAVCKINKVFIYRAPEYSCNELTGHLILEKVFIDFYDDTTCIDWTDDSRIIAIGSKDGVVKLHSIYKEDKFQVYVLSGHSDIVKAVFFESNSLHINTLSKNGELIIWECNMTLPGSHCQKQYFEELNEDICEISDWSVAKKKEKNITSSVSCQDNFESCGKIQFTRLSKFYLNDYNKFEKFVSLNTCAYHKQNRILVTGFSNGSIFIHELPNITLIHSLSASEYGIGTISLNNIGDWIAIGCEYEGQFLVWEWQSETYILKQHTHNGVISSIGYSNDGLFIVTGGKDGKIKIWNVCNGYCVVTFSTHSSSISAVKFSNNGKFVISSSLDGTVRAHDMYRYRNFRIFTTPSSVQFSCLAIDSTDEFVAAGAQDVFHIYVWSIKLGHLIECLTGHEGPVSSITFCPTICSSSLISVSWDKTLRLWNTVETGEDCEIIELMSEALCVAYKSDGKEIAVATLNGHIMFFNSVNGSQVHDIDGRNDLGTGTRINDRIITGKKKEIRSFTSIAYCTDGNLIIAAGHSKYVCIYHIAEEILLKKFEVTQNKSLDSDFIRYGKMTEFGNIDLIEKRTHLSSVQNKIRIPGRLKNDMLSFRTAKSEICVYDIAFSPAGSAWSAVTTEGVLIYSLDSDLRFDPFQLDINITPEAIQKNLIDKNYLETLIGALKLGETEIVLMVLKSIKLKDIELLTKSLPTSFVDRLLKIISISMDSSFIEFYLTWIENLLNAYYITNQFYHAVLITIHTNLSKLHYDLSKVSSFNKYTMKFIKEKSKNRLICQDKMQIAIMS